jgi:hypothetical protein
MKTIILQKIMKINISILISLNLFLCIKLSQILIDQFTKQKLKTLFFINLKQKIILPTKFTKHPKILENL